jgi:hypothetical protein
MSDMATASLVLSTIILLIAALLGWREWRDRRDRAPDLSPEDARYFAYQNARRSLGIVVLVLLAVGLVVGSRVPTRVDNKTNPQFLGIWLGVFLLIFVLLALAMVDWVALRLFARRHRHELLRERIEIIQEEKRRREALRDDGNANGEILH